MYTHEPQVNEERERKLRNIKYEIHVSLVNCADIGKDAYGDYIEKLTASLMGIIKEL